MRHSTRSNLLTHFKSRVLITTGLSIFAIVSATFGCGGAKQIEAMQSPTASLDATPKKDDLDLTLDAVVDAGGSTDPFKVTLVAMTEVGEILVSQCAPSGGNSAAPKTKTKTGDKCSAAITRGASIILKADVVGLSLDSSRWRCAGLKKSESRFKVGLATVTATTSSASATSIACTFEHAADSGVLSTETETSEPSPAATENDAGEAAPAPARGPAPDVVAPAQA